MEEKNTSTTITLVIKLVNVGTLHRIGVCVVMCAVALAVAVTQSGQTKKGFGHANGLKQAGH